MANPGVGPRAGKEDFMRALGLDSSSSHHEGYYRAMRVSHGLSCSRQTLTNIQDEAITTYNILQADRNSLVDDRRSDPNTQPPYFWHHVTRERQQWAIVSTWQNAQVGTTARMLFDRGATNGEHGPNWVTQWLLYSVFRSRDTRNNRSRRNGEANSSNSSSGMYLISPSVPGDL